ncbi:alpha/beta hydrolase [Allopontixanthobacter sp.]|uniref:alpha/beta hydrolase n=1 Tax=Allopontixanthobacter sp. TaxID=2906452 RepID=UPI002AB9AA33|nr:alpha/beta hydrolase [Allopontixanthobacter sp.]MDZ4306321.1 alpha/beta hydrolase [Allopontixanthobacter sp.]
MTDIQFHTLPGRRRIAFRHAKGAGPALVFLPGYMSDMTGSKAAAMFEWARAQGRSCLLLDYSGCGSSSGDFAEGTLSAWRDEVLDLVAAKCPGPITLVGSSMGGWLMLLVGLALGDRLAAMVGIAAAPDFSDWGYDEEQKARLERGETVHEDNPYGPDSTPTYAKFWHDAQANRRLDSEIAISCPVRLLHGQNDRDVPWELSLRLAQQLRSDDIQVTLVKSGDHRLSRDEDIALLLDTVARLPIIASRS